MSVSSIRQDPDNGFFFRLAQPFNNGSEYHYPAMNGGVINLNPSFSLDLFNVTVAELIRQIITDGFKNDVLGKLIAFELILDFADRDNPTSRVIEIQKPQGSPPKVIPLSEWKGTGEINPELFPKAANNEEFEVGDLEEAILEFEFDQAL